MKISVSVGRPVQLVCALCISASALAPASAQTAADRSPAAPAAGTAAPSAATANPGPAAVAAAPVLTDAQRRAGDAAWEALQTSVRAAGAVKVTQVGGPVAASRTEAAKMKSERLARAKKLREVAQRAKEFRAQHPTHPQLGGARKLEVISDLEGILPADRVHRQAAEANARVFRTDAAQPLTDRMEVADLVERRAIREKVPGHDWTKNPVLAETMLDRMKSEFGDRPEIWARYLNLAENTYCDAGRDVAYRIVQSPVAAEATKAAARRILERYSLVRKPLDFAVTPTQGRPTTLAQLAGKTTVVVLWDGTKLPGGPPGLGDFQKNPRPNTTWIYISVGELGPKPKGKAGPPLPPGFVAVESANRGGPAARLLQPTHLPFALVLDEQKRLSGYGRVDEIPALIAGIGRKELR